MNERVFADDFRKSFLEENEFLDFLRSRETNAWWKKVEENAL